MIKFFQLFLFVFSSFVLIAEEGASAAAAESLVETVRVSMRETADEIEKSMEPGSSILIRNFTLTGNKTQLGDYMTSLLIAELLGKKMVIYREERGAEKASFLLKGVLYPLDNAVNVAVELSALESGVILVALNPVFSVENSLLRKWLSVSPAIETLVHTGHDEPNNTIETATVYPIGSRFETVLTQGDIDWFVFDLPLSDAGIQERILLLRTLGGVDTEIFLYGDSQGINLLDSNDDVNDDDYSSGLEIKLAVGRYYLKVQGYESSENGEYTLYSTILSE